MKLLLGDCLEVLKSIEDNSVDAVVTDPPYGLGKEPDIVELMKAWSDHGFLEMNGKGFMGKEWDAFVPQPIVWKEVYRVLKPGGYLLSFFGSRTYDLGTLAIRWAGFEIRDMIAWVYGSGFPKSLNIGKAIDDLLGNERESLGVSTQGSGASRIKLSNHEKGDTGIGYMDGSGKTFEITKGNSEWEGWGTALKPALEPITVARKPIAEKTVAKNVLKYGTGGINIDGCRISINPKVDDPRLGGKGDWSSDKMAKNVYEGGYAGNRVSSSPQGRFPANLIHDGSEEVTSLFPDSKSTGGSGEKSKGGLGKQIYGKYALEEHGANSGGLGDSGSASRFFYCAKASKKDRNEGCDNLEDKQNNIHPTVKPTDLMQYLVRLVTPPNGTVLDPFMGSGSTGKACVREGFDFIGIELDEEYLNIAKNRIEYEKKKKEKEKPFWERKKKS